MRYHLYVISISLLMAMITKYIILGTVKADMDITRPQKKAKLQKALMNAGLNGF